MVPELPIPIPPELDAAFLAARAGADIVSHFFRHGVSIRGKQSYNLVTDADIESERAIVRQIGQRFPDHAILSEEEHSERKAAEHLLVIDPLDGTNNFAHQVPQFAVSIAYFHQGQPKIGVVLDPLGGDCFFAVAGQGAYCGSTRLRVDAAVRLDQALIGVGFYYDRGLIMEETLLAIRDLFRRNIHGIRRFGAASLDLCWVAAGRFSGFFEFELSSWDFAAGALIVQEAGGIVTTCQGHPLPLEKSSVLASNGPLHAAILGCIQPHYECCLGNSTSDG